MNAMRQIEKIDEDCAVMVAAMLSGVDEVCWNCGDGRGWTVSFDWNGTPEQVQCPCEGRAWILDVYTMQDINRIMRDGKR